MKTNQDHQQEGANTPPVHSADYGRVRASVWAHVENGTTQYKITLSRSFLQKDGAWSRGRTFYQSELAAVVEVCARVQLWIERQQRAAQTQPTLAGT